MFTHAGDNLTEVYSPINCSKSEDTTSLGDFENVSAFTNPDPHLSLVTLMNYAYPYLEC